MIAEMPKLTPKSSSKKKKPEAMALTDPAGVVEDLPLKMEAPVTLDESKFVRFPNSPYQLYQPFPPAGDQPAAIDALVAGIEDGLTFQTLLGVTGSGKTFTMANVIVPKNIPTTLPKPPVKSTPPTTTEMIELKMKLCPPAT